MKTYVTWLASLLKKSSQWVLNTERLFLQIFSNSQCNCYRKGDPSQSPRVGFCVTLGNTLSKETHVLTKEETLLGRTVHGESRRISGSSGTALPCGLQFQVFMVMGLVSRWSLANHSDSGSFLVTQALLNQDGFQRGGFWEVGRTCGIFFWFFPNSSPCSLFLTRTTCCKITHANSYNGA